MIPRSLIVLNIPALPLFVSAEVGQVTSNVVNVEISASVTVDIDHFFIETDSGAALNVTEIIGGNGTTSPQIGLDRQIFPGENLYLTYSGDAVTVFVSEPITNNVHIDYWNDFTGNVNDSVKGSITNPNSSQMSITYNGGSLRFLRVLDTTVGSLGNYFKAKRKNGDDFFPKGRVYMSYISRFSGFTNSQWMLRILSDTANNYAQFYNGGSSQIYVNIVSGGVLRYTFNSGLTAGDYFVKIKHDANDNISFYYWNGSSWTQIGTTQNWDIGSVIEYRAESLSNSNDAQNHSFLYATWRVTNQDFTTLIPEQQFF